MHARAVQRLRKTLGRDLSPTQVAAATTAEAPAPRRKRPVLQMAKARLGTTAGRPRVPNRKPKPAGVSVSAPVAARRRA